MALNADFVEGVALTNFKALAEMGAINALGHSKRLDIIAETALVTALDRLNTTDVPEGLGLSAAQRGDLSKVTAELGGTIAALQQLMKGAGNTPPVTP
jgi:hypothetical protein